MTFIFSMKFLVSEQFDIHKMLQRWYRELLHTPSPVSPLAICCISAVQLSQLMNPYWHIIKELKPVLYLCFLKFCLMSFFWSTVPSWIWCISWSHHLRLLLAVIVPQTFFGFGDLDCFEYWLIIWRMFLKWDLSDVFLMIRLELWIWEMKTTVTISSYLVKDTNYQQQIALWWIMLILITWLR